MKKILFLVLGIVLFYSCSISKEGGERFYELSQSKNGNLLEKYLPEEETTLFFSLRLNDFNPKVLKSIFLNAFSNEIKDISTMENFGDNKVFQGFDYEKDIKPLGAEGNQRLAYAVLKNPSQEKDSIYLTYNVANEEKFEELADLLLKNSGYKKSLYKETEIYFNEEESIYLAYLRQMVFVVNKMDNLRALINDPEGEKVQNSLLKSKKYNLLLNKMSKDYLMFLYLNIGKITDNTSKTEDSVFDSLFFAKTGDLSHRGFFVTKGEKDKYVISAVSLDKDARFPAENNRQIYLHKSLPAENLLFLLELTDGMAFLQRLPENARNEEFRRFTLLADALGFDYSRLIEPVLKGNIAMAIYQSDSIIPDFLLAADLRGKKAEGMELLRKINQKIDEYIAQGENQKNNVFEKEEIDFSGDKFYRLRIKLGFLIEQFSFLTNLPDFLEIYYGISQNALYLGVYKNLLADLGRDRLNDTFKLEGGSTGTILFYFDSEKIFSYLDWIKKKNTPLNSQIVQYENSLANYFLLRNVLFLGKDHIGTQLFEAVLAIK